MTKHLIFSAIGFCLSLRSLFACDFCACLSGINPYYNGKNRVALNALSQRSFRPPLLAPPISALPSKHSQMPTMMHGGHGASPFPTTETRQTIEMMIQHHVSERLMLTVLLPFSAMTIQQGASLSVLGFGDATLLAHFVVRPDWFESSTILLGCGLKTPTGLNNLVDAGGTRLDTRFQSGSGSWDFIMNPAFIAQASGLTYALDLFAKFNGSNARGDRLGHSLSATTTISRDLLRNNAAQTALISIAGARFEAKARDWISGRYDADSDFAAIYAQLGGQIIFHFVKVDVLALVPIHQARSPLSLNEQTRFLTGARVEF